MTLYDFMASANIEGRIQETDIKRHGNVSRDHFTPANPKRARPKARTFTRRDAHSLNLYKALKCRKANRYK